MGGGQKPQKPAIMNRSSEACHSWQTGRSQPGRVRPALSGPRNPLCLFLPPPPPWVKATTEGSVDATSNLLPNEEGLAQPQPWQCQEDKQRPSVSITKTVFSSHIILSVMSSLASKGTAVSYIIIIISSPQRWRAPGRGSFCQTSLLMAKGLPLMIEATGGDICIPIRPRALKSLGGGHWQSVCQFK